ncbi:MAG: hypothetical protein ACOC0N_08720 [Chroococcales cyanobacterium]
MSVAPYPFDSNRREKPRRRTRRQRKVTAIAPTTTARKVSKLRPKSPERIPAWLRSLLLLQKSSGVLAFGLVSFSMIVYASTVYTQRLWTKEYRKLQVLERHQRNLITTNEALKHQLALEAQTQASGLVPTNPAHTIFLNPSPAPLVEKAEVAVESEIDLGTAPLGY